MYVNTNPAGNNRYSSQQLSVPQLGNQAGDMLLMLDAVLVTGFGEKTPLSASIDGNLVTFDFGVGHGFLEKQILLVSGANDSLLNGKHRISAMTSNTLTMNITGVTSAVGNIKMKVAPLGWESVLGNSNPLVRAYKSTDPTSSGHVLHLDMSSPTGFYHATSPAVRAMMSIYDGAENGVLGTDITSTTNNRSNNPNGLLFWYQKRGKSYLDPVINNNVFWDIVGNSKFFYFVTNWSSFSSANSSYDHFYNAKTGDIYCFGDYIKLSEDVFNPLMFKCSLSTNDSATSSTIGNDYSFSDSVGSLVRHYDSGSLAFSRQSPYIVPNSAIVDSGYINGTQYPNDNGNIIFTQPVRLFSSTTTSTVSKVRGVMPSMLFVESATRGSLYNVVANDVLLLTIQGNGGASYIRPNNIGFYIGD